VAGSYTASSQLMSPWTWLFRPVGAPRWRSRATGESSNLNALNNRGGALTSGTAIVCWLRPVAGAGIGGYWPNIRAAMWSSVGLRADVHAVSSSCRTATVLGKNGSNAKCRLQQSRLLCSPGY